MSDGPADSTLDIRLLAAGRALNIRKQHLEQEVTSLFEQWRPALLRYAATFGLPQQHAEEIVQDVFLALFSHLKQEKGRRNLRAWLFRVTHNLALKWRNTEPPVTETDMDVDALPHPALNPEEELANSRRQRQLQSILRALPEQDRRCLYLRAEGLRYREIAEITGMSLGAIAQSLERSLNRFQRAYRR